MKVMLKFTSTKDPSVSCHMGPYTKVELECGEGGVSTVLYGLVAPGRPTQGYQEIVARLGVDSKWVHDKSIYDKLEFIVVPEEKQ
jgi:hypothetical protein